MRHPRFLALVPALLVLLLMFAGCKSSDRPARTPSPNKTEQSDKTPSDSAPATGTKSTPSTSASVEMIDFSMNPDQVTIAKGGKVTWTNKDSVEHTITADDGSFDSGLLPTDESFSRTFEEPGTFTYHCTPHPSMTGTVIVK